MTLILSLDDEPEMLQLMELIVLRSGYHHISTTDSYEAWALLQTQPVDLFTQDIMRPDIDGWTFLRLMKSDPHLRDIPVLGMSAGLVNTRAEQARLAGLDIETDLAYYVTKPFGPQELLSAIHTVLLQHGKPLPTAEDQAQGQSLFAQRRAEMLRSSEREAHPLTDSLPFEALQQALQSGDVTQRWTAAKALGFAQNPLVVDALAAALQDENYVVRMMAARALVKFGTLVDAPLMMALANDNRWVRQIAVAFWGRIKDARAVEPLVALLADEDSWVRQTAALALGQIQDKRAIQPLEQAMDDPEPDVWRSASFALAQLGEPEIDPLVEKLQQPNDRVRQVAAHALGQFRDRRVVEPLLRALTDESRWIRLAAVHALGYVLSWVKDDRAAEPLIAALTDDDVQVRVAIVSALGWLGGARGIQPLLKALHDDAPGVREASARALLKIEPALAQLLDQLRDENPQVRKTVARALWMTKGDSVAQALMAALQDPDADVVEAAIHSLGYAKARQAIPCLEQLIERELQRNPKLAKAAESALRFMQTNPSPKTCQVYKT